MPRLVRLTATGPLKIEASAMPADKPVWICQCGLSAKFPYCDGAHKITRAEEPGKLYVYTPDGRAVAQVHEEPPRATTAGGPPPA